MIQEGAYSRTDDTGGRIQEGGYRREDTGKEDTGKEDT